MTGQEQGRWQKDVDRLVIAFWRKRMAQSAADQARIAELEAKRAEQALAARCPKCGSKAPGLLLLPCVLADDPWHAASSHAGQIKALESKLKAAEASRDFMPAPRCTLEYHGRKSATRSRGFGRSAARQACP